MAEYSLNSPLTTAEVVQLQVGDKVYINGHIYGLRDATLIRMFDQKIKAPADLTGALCLHTAPNVEKIGPGKYKKVCVGTTTSTRMDRFTEGLLTEYGVKAIIGKGGQYEKGTRALKEHKGIYLSIVGGAASLETTQIEEIEEVWWEDLFPECLWKFKVKDFGPLIVSIDSHGNNLYFQVKERAKQKIKNLIASRLEAI
ncbi:MAG: FumA C-terminus/TtdB family hydratase beta subunit [Peptococcaceae bacterium]